MYQEFFINEFTNRALEATGLALDELEHVVGRFGKQSSRAGMLRGRIRIYATGKVEIRKCFGSQLLWTNQ